MSTAYGNSYSVADADVSERAAFIRRTYAHLAGAILALIGLDSFLLTQPWAIKLASTMMGGSWLLVLGGFMVISWLATSFASNPRSKIMQYAGLGIYTLAWSILFLPILLIAQQYGLRTGQPVIMNALVCTGGIFAGLTMVAMFTRADFSFLRSFLIIGGFIALAVIVVGTMKGFELGLFFSAAMVVFASLSILYNTSQILHNYGTDQHVAAALSLFGSVAMLFWYILRIFMARD